MMLKVSLLAAAAFAADSGCKWSTTDRASGCLTAIMEDTLATGLSCAFAMADNEANDFNKAACQATDSCEYITDPAVMCVTPQFKKFAQSKEGRDGFMCGELKNKGKCEGNGSCTWLDDYEDDDTISTCQGHQMGSDTVYCKKYTKKDKCNAATPPKLGGSSAAPANAAAVLLASVFAIFVSSL